CPRARGAGVMTAGGAPGAPGAQASGSTSRPAVAAAARSSASPPSSPSAQTAPPTLPVIALAGAANSGKTTLFNALTGSHYNTVNYPGATVEYAFGTSRHLPGFTCRVMDTPGLTSLLPASPDEK